MKKKMNEERGSSLMGLIAGKSHEEARDAIIKSIQEDLITQSLLGEGLSSEDAGLLRSDPSRYMDNQMQKALGNVELSRLHPRYIGPSACGGNLSYYIVHEWPERISTDVRIDRMAPPEALRRHGETAVESYKASMSSTGYSVLARGSLWRVILCPVMIRTTIDTAVATSFGGDEATGFMFYDVISQMFTGISIDLDLAAYHAVMNYDAAMKMMKSEEGLMMEYGGKGEFLLLRMTETGEGLPDMTLALGVLKR